MIPIIDTHVHLWDLERFRLPWLESGAPLARDFSMDDYRAAIDGLGVVRGVYMEVDVDESQQVEEAESVIELCRTDDLMAGAVISGRPIADDFASYLDRFRDRPEVKGLRQVLHVASTPPGYCLDDRFMRGIRLLGERDLSFDLCVRHGELPDVIRLVDACPDTRFVLDHCGNPDVRADDRSAWRDAISRLADREHVDCKVSGIAASVDPDGWSPDDLAPIVNHVLDAFGPDRVVFGGDWPVCTLGATLREWVEALRAIIADRDPINQRKLLHDNALRIYRLG